MASANSSTTPFRERGSLPFSGGATLTSETGLSTDLEVMMMTFITQGGEGQGKTSKKKSKATKSKGRGREEGASRTLMREVGEEGCGGRG